ncbi:MAG: c-type cytochrome [Leptolyngbyaceae cyanobacterium bins.59]|nr:c-type cytochrome [Leptolyngbyaceae cyanobacterium bins.59]
MFKTLLRTVILAIVCWSLSLIFIPFSQPVLATVGTPNVAAGAKIFSANCAACHLGGNNVIMGDKTLKKAALEKYLPDFQAQPLETIIYQVKNGKNAMPAFSGRLSDDQIADVAAYVLGQAEKGW